MSTAVSLVNAYLRFNGYVAVMEQPILVGQGRPYRYHTATDVDILAVRFPNAAMVIPRDSGRPWDDDLHLDIDPMLDLEDDTVDVIIGEVKEGRPRINEALLSEEVLYATMRRVDAGFDEPIRRTIQQLLRQGVARCEAGGRRWRFRLVAFGVGVPIKEKAPFHVVQLADVARFLMECMRRHRQVWRDAQFGESVLDLLHLFDKLGLAMVADGEPADEGAETGLEAAPPAPETVVALPWEPAAPPDAALYDEPEDSHLAETGEMFATTDRRPDTRTRALPDAPPGTLPDALPGAAPGALPGAAPAPAADDRFPEDGKERV